MAYQPAYRKLALVVASSCVLLSGCAETPTSETDLTNDYSNRLGWTLTPDGVGPIKLGWTFAQALNSDFFEALEPESDDVCGASTPRLAGDYTDPESGESVLYVNWSFEGLDHVGGLLLKYPSNFRTPEGIGVGSSSSELRAAYGARLQTAKFDWVNLGQVERVPVVFGDVGALVFQVEDGAVATMQVLSGRPGEVLVNAAPGGC